MLDEEWRGLLEDSPPLDLVNLHILNGRRRAVEFDRSPVLSPAAVPHCDYCFGPILLSQLGE